MAHQALYMECFSGISGDMMLGALLDLGADREGLLRLIDSLPIDGYEIRHGRTHKQGIASGYFHVDLKHKGDAHVHYGGHEMHEDAHKVLAPHGHAHYEDVDHGDAKYACDNHEHTNHEQANHEHTNHASNHYAHSEQHIGDLEKHDEHFHSHPHIHRNLADIQAIIESIDAPARVKQLSNKMFSIVADAEARAHGVPVEQVHFHEVGAVDSIIDIIGVAYCLWSIGVDDVYISSLYEGQGHVRCAHGLLPIPVPAVRNIAEAHGLPMTFTETKGEMVTPTGAAIAAALWNGKKLPEGVRILKTGIGAGEKDFPHANILRVSLVELEEKAAQESDIWVLETNMDDVTGEALGYTMEKLMAAGARDTYYSSIFMKKGRPAYLLRVICDEADIEKLEKLIFTHTTTIGIRRYPVQRHVLEREIDLVNTEWGQVHIKKCRLGDSVRMYPEYEDVRKICEQTDLGFSGLYQKIKAQAERNSGEWQESDE